MSFKVAALVRSRIIGSAALKAVLLNMADRANDGGGEVYASKATIAAETELGRTTVKMAIRDLVGRCLIFEVGTRACKNGHTVEYALNLDGIAALPEWRGSATGSTADPVHSGPGPEGPPYPVHSGPPTGSVADPNPSYEPSSEPSKEEEVVVVARARASEREEGSLDDFRRRYAEAQERFQDALRTANPHGFPWTAPMLLEAVLIAVGYKGRRVPRYWLPETAERHVSKWVQELGLTPEQVIAVASESRIQNPEPPKGPKALDDHMRALSVALHQPPLKPTPVH